MIFENSRPRSPFWKNALWEKGHLHGFVLQENRLFMVKVPILSCNIGTFALQSLPYCRVKAWLSVGNVSVFVFQDLAFRWKFLPKFFSKSVNF